MLQLINFHMSKYFVLYCMKNLHRPYLYRTLNSIKTKQRTISTIQYEQFSSEIEAEKFLFPKKIKFLLMKEEFDKRGLDIDFIQEKTFEISEHEIDDEARKISQIVKDPSLGILLDGNTSSIKKETKKNKKNDNQHQKHEEEIEEIEEIEEDNDGMKINKNGEYIQKESNKPEQIQEDAVREITNLKLQKTFDYLMRLQGSATHFNKSTPLIQIKSTDTYRGFFDGCSKGNPGRSGAGYSLCNRSGRVIFKRSLYLGFRTNNEAEFMAFLYLLLDCRSNKVQNIQVYGDSNLVVKGIRNQMSIQAFNLRNFNLLGKYFKEKFENFSIEHIRREQNQVADKLANKGLTMKMLYDSEGQQQNIKKKKEDD